MSERSSTSRRAGRTKNSPKLSAKTSVMLPVPTPPGGQWHATSVAEAVSAAVMGVDRFGVEADVNEADEATQTADLERGERPREDPPVGGKGGCGFDIAMSASP
jgi:hypothetical protein